MYIIEYKSAEPFLNPHFKMFQHEGQRIILLFTEPHWRREKSDGYLQKDFPDFLHAMLADFQTAQPLLAHFLHIEFLHFYLLWTN